MDVDAPKGRRGGLPSTETAPIKIDWESWHCRWFYQSFTEPDSQPRSAQRTTLRRYLFEAAGGGLKSFITFALLVWSIPVLLPWIVFDAIAEASNQDNWYGLDPAGTALFLLGLLIIMIARQIFHPDTTWLGWLLLRYGIWAIAVYPVDTLTFLLLRGIDKIVALADRCLPHTFLDRPVEFI